MAEKLTKEQVKQIFEYGRFYEMALRSGDDFPVDLPENYNEAIESVYKVVVEKDYNNECLQCREFALGGCKGKGNIKIANKNKCALKLLGENNYGIY